MAILQVRYHLNSIFKVTPTIDLSEQNKNIAQTDLWKRVHTLEYSEIH